MSQDFTLEPDDVASLPLDDLAMRVLVDARENGEWNWMNWMKMAAIHGYSGRPDAVGALMEAWTWLRNRGLVVPDVEQGSVTAFVISRQGHEALEKGLPWLRAVQRLDLELVPELEARARPPFLRGDFEGAAFMAMKEVEVAVRELGGFPSSVIGTALMQEAFRPGGKGRDGQPGPLADVDGDPGEAVATMDLFKGAIGLFKNPSSHRRVDFDDATEAAEIVLLADLLMRLLRKGRPEERA
jgi:uncharacterized protein (TIGR02391 family)